MSLTWQGGPRPRRVIGLLGGVASGKTLVAECLEALGAGRLDADRAGHEALRDPQVIAALEARFGREVLVEGQLDRKAIATRVFAPPPAGPANLAFLESLTHPRIGEILMAQAEELTAAGHELLVLDAAVMLKAGWHQLCDKVIFVDAPPEVRRRRAMTRGWSEAEFAAREGAQESLDEKRRHADFVIDNSGSPESTRAQVERLWPELSR